MQRKMTTLNRELKTYCQSEANDGFSAWVALGRRNQMQLMKRNPKGVPQLNSNEVYMFLMQKHGYSVLGDRPYDFFKAYFWIGSRAPNHELKVETAMSSLNELYEEAKASGRCKLRISLEFQYAESPQFFTLFQPVEPLNENGTKIDDSQDFIYALQYQEYLRDDTQAQKQRAIAFPKVLTFELDPVQKTPTCKYIRIYEKAYADRLLPRNKQHVEASNRVFMLLKGVHVNNHGQQVVSTAAAEPFSQMVTGGELLVGARATQQLVAFAVAFARGLEASTQAKNRPVEKIEIVTQFQEQGQLPAAWQTFLDASPQLKQTEHDVSVTRAAQQGSKPKDEWCIGKYQLPFQIVSHNWKAKSSEERQLPLKDLDRDTNIYKQPNAISKDIHWEKRGHFLEDFDKRRVNLFRVALEPKFQGPVDQIASDVSSDQIPTLFNLQLEKLKVTRVTHEQMSSRQIYLMSTPVHLYLWLGSEIESIKRLASLRILQAFSKQILEEDITSLSHQSASEGLIQKKRFQVETEGYESRQFQALLGKMTAVPGRDNRLDFIMMRRPRFDQEEDEEEVDSGAAQESHEGLNPALANALQYNRSQTSGQNRLDSMKIRKNTINNRMSVKVNLRNNESKLLLKNLNLLAKQKKTNNEEENKGLDMEENKQRQNLIMTMRQSRQEDQGRYFEQIRASFNPLNIIQASEKNQPLQKGPSNVKKAGEFDAIWQYEILGRKFEQIENPLRVGIVEATKSYFIVFFKDGKASIALWRGRDQTMMTHRRAVQFFKQTKFRLVKNSMRAKGVRSQSNLQDVNKFMSQNKSLLPGLDGDSDAPLLGDAGKSQSELVIGGLGLDIQTQKRMSKDESSFKEQLRHSLRPIDQVQQTKDHKKLMKEHSMNLEPVKRDEQVTQINLRSVVVMDNEPSFFLEAFQGALIVSTGEYLMRNSQIFEGQDDQEEQHVMLFQILGSSGLNQKAREVPPFKDSLTSSGLFVLLSRSRIIFWAGSNYFSSYLNEQSFEHFSNLVSEELLTKLALHYDQSVSLMVDHDEEGEEGQKNAASLSIEDKKTSYFVEGIEGHIWHEFMDGAKPYGKNVPGSLFGSRKTVTKNYNRLRTMKMNQMIGFDEAQDESEATDDAMAEDSDNLESSDEDLEFVDYENEITREKWLPAEPKLFLIHTGKRFVKYGEDHDDEESGIESENSGSDQDDDEELDEDFRIDNHRTHSEYMTLRQVGNFTQKHLRSNCIYVLDFDSDIFVWIGSKVKGELVVESFKKIGQAVEAIHSKGRRRKEKASFSITYQGFEPTVFKNAFPVWQAFPREGIDNDIGEISEEDSDGSSVRTDSEGEEEKKEQPSAAQVDSEMDERTRKKLANYVPETFWINF